MPSESRVAALLALNAILFGWDVYLALLSARFLCHIRHDGYIDRPFGPYPYMNV